MLFKIFLLFFLLSSPLSAFDLFDPDRGKSQKIPTPAAHVNPFLNLPKPEAKAKPTSTKTQKAQRNFTLRGTMQLGKKRIAFLQAPDGKEIPELELIGKTGHIPIAGYEGFALLEVRSRVVKIAYPDNAPCRVSSQQTGVVCVDNGKAAELTLKDHKPMKPKPKPKIPTPMPLNPFAPRVVNPLDAKKREAEVAKRRELYKNFKRKEIRDEDAPPGMRVVHTPFGDRLVPDTSR